jgi:outer membrane protein assembly factor BamB
MCQREPSWLTASATSRTGSEICWAVNATDGKLIWSTQLVTYFWQSVWIGPLPTSPAVVAGEVYLGRPEGAYLLAVTASSNGVLLWKRQLESVDPRQTVLVNATDGLD